MRVLTQIFSVGLGSLLLVICSVLPALALNTMIDYTSLPPIVTEPTDPNVLIMISNDHTGFFSGYNSMTDYDNSVEYWGYFDPLKEYSYSNSNVFVPEGWTGTDDDGSNNHYTSSDSNWSGNFLNWVTMTHADFLRKALTGGKRSVDSSADGQTTLQRGDVPDDEDHPWKKSYSGSDLNRLVPLIYAHSSYEFYNTGTTMRVQKSDGAEVVRNKSTFDVEVKVCFNSMPEIGCTPYQSNYKPEGLLQRYHDKMRFGLMSYSHAKMDQGGVLRTKISTITDEFSQVNGSVNNSSDSMLLYIEQYTSKGWDPLAEMLYEGIRYFRGNEAAQAAYCGPGNFTSDDSFQVHGCESNKKWDDPVTQWCQKNNIIIINDEYPSHDDDKLPNSAFSDYTDTPAFAGVNGTYNPDLLAITNAIGVNEGLSGKQLIADFVGNTGTDSCASKNFPGLGNIRGICPKESNSRGTYYLAGLAYDAFTEDMRDDFDHKQSIRTFAIAFRASVGDDLEGKPSYKVPPPPLNQMWLAGKYGNFDDKDGDGMPNLDSEWMKSPENCDPDDPDDYDCLPKGFFYADGGDAIGKAVEEVFNAILRRSASGTAVSVLATSGQGEGNLVQAYYRPAIAEGERDITWTGYLQSLWVDKYGYIREDSNHNLSLDEDDDSVIKYFLDSDGTTRVRRYAVSADAPFPDLINDSFDVIDMGGVEVVWEAGQALVDTAADDRKILTFIDKNNDGFVDSGEFVDLDQSNKIDIKPYLALQDETSNEDLGTTENNRVQNLIAFTRGDDPVLNATPFAGKVTVRDRVLGGNVWKLGDIINSTPVSVSAPPDRFDLIYGDESYNSYYNKYDDRETIIYTGANDGMLHAFTSWSFNQSTQKYEKPAAAASTETVGSEIWAYVPQNLLPHLKWLSRPSYTHVFYMDLQPRIFDARIFTDDADTSSTSLHPGGWGTVLVTGMNMGGGRIQVTGDFDYDGVNDNFREFKPSFMAFDITDPRNPKLLWERAYDGLGFSWTIPTVVRVGAKADPGQWYLIFGNGPDAGDSGTPNYKGESVTNGKIYIVDMLTGAPETTVGQEWWDEVADQRAFFNTPIAYDRELNYNVDAAYMATTFDNDTNTTDSVHDWQGSVYRILSWDPATDQYLPDPSNWSLEKVFASPRPITAPGALTVDGGNNTWAYFGTGRYLSKGVDSDEVSDVQEYLIGIKDPFYNSKYKETSPKYYENLGENKILDSTDLIDSTDFKILNTGSVMWDNGTSIVDPPFTVGGATNIPWNFEHLLAYVGEHDGWMRKLPVGVTAEKSLNKPAVIGGLTLFTTFSPKGDVCDYGGFSTLWALFYETGTAFYRSVFRGGYGEEDIDIDGVTHTVINESFDLGSGTTSSVGIHLGKQNDRSGEDGVQGDLATGFVQQGTGTVIDIEFETALKVRSGLRSWEER
jgi:type IV pilus assembly protein PilY1